MAVSMHPSDLAMLVVLGTAHGYPASPEAVATAARQLAPQDWQPTGDIIGSAIERAIARGLVTGGREPDAATAAVQTTPLGHLRIVDLLRKPIPRSTGGFVRACATAKLCFLHHLPQTERSDHAEQLAELYRGAMALLLRMKQLPRPLAGSVLEDLRFELIRMESELAWLDGLAEVQVECRSHV